MCLCYSPLSFPLLRIDFSKTETAPSGDKISNSETLKMVRDMDQQHKDCYKDPGSFETCTIGFLK